eukprot:1142389-Pelagomonas_calceolata.AAC.3
MHDYGATCSNSHATWDRSMTLYVFREATSTQEHACAHTHTPLVQVPNYGSSWLRLPSQTVLWLAPHQHSWPAGAGDPGCGRAAAARAASRPAC